MSDTTYPPRVKKLDVAFVSDRLKDFMAAKARQEELVRTRKGGSLQSTFSGVYSNSEYAAFYQFGLGYPVDKIRQTFAEAANAAVEVFKLRGTLECRTDLPGVKDYSLTNSRDCFQAVCMALIADEYGIAQKLAALMWDPPKADYIGPDSEVCTNNQQRLAYAVKHLFEDHLDEVHQELQRISPRKGEQQVAALGKMVCGLAQSSDALFNEGLLELLYFHRQTARRADGPQRFFSLAGVALSNLAIRRGLVNKSDLPRDEFLPLELVS
jgi:hypothetical protein